MTARDDRVEQACRLAQAIDAADTVDVAAMLAALGLRANAHSWPEIQTVLHAHRNGRPVLPVRRRAIRSNMFEPDADHGSDDFDVAEFSYAEVSISRSAGEAFAGTDLALRILAGCAVRHGDYRPGREGSHIVAFRDHSFILSPDGQVVIGYRLLQRRPATRSSHGETATSDVKFSVDTFSPDTVTVLPRVVDGFANKHGTDLDEAEAEIRGFLRWALEKGKCRALDNGCGLFELRGFRVWVSPDGRTVTKYRTEHIERTPGDVRNGVPSRFGRRRER
jgi:hypothetical protein